MIISSSPARCFPFLLLFLCCRCVLLGAARNCRISSPYSKSGSRGGVGGGRVRRRGMVLEDEGEEGEKKSSPRELRRGLLIGAGTGAVFVEEEE